MTDALNASPRRIAPEDAAARKSAALRGLEVSTRAAALGFDWACAADVLDKIAEELGEIREAIADGMPLAHVQEEVGDLFFALVNFTRKMQIDPDAAFDGGVAKFERRFAALEGRVRDAGRSLNELSMEELESVWQSVKEEESHAR